MKVWMVAKELRSKMRVEVYQVVGLATTIEAAKALAAKDCEGAGAFSGAEWFLDNADDDATCLVLMDKGATWVSTNCYVITEEPVHEVIE
jgi:hypothetical protein